MSKSKLLIIETTYRLETNLPQLGIVTRRPLGSIAAVIEDTIGASCILPSQNRVTLTETGATVNDSLSIEMSPLRRTGGRLLSENKAINIRPITDSGTDSFLAQGLPINHTRSKHSTI